MATANDTPMVKFGGKNPLGNNLGYYNQLGNTWTNQQLALKAQESGARSLVVYLPDRSISGNSQTVELANVQYYDSIGLKDLVGVIGEPNIPGQNGAGLGTPYNREKGVFPNTGGFSAITFKGMYLDIWTDGTKTTPNPNNTLAVYMFKVVNTYGEYVKFWQIVNEPDQTGTGEGWDTSSAGYWGKIDPKPEHLKNMLAPIQFYIRMLRVCYEVIKTLKPNSYVCLGGIGYPSFLDAICRNTDNPGASYTGFDAIASNITNGITYASYTGVGAIGSVTTDFPLKGGAYFDVVSYHDYPMYSLSYWDNTPPGSVRFHWESDFCVDVHINYKNSYDAVLTKFSYNGTIFPKKQFITTEVDVARTGVTYPNGGYDWGNEAAQNNFIIKMHTLSQVNGIAGVWKYGMGNGGDSAANIFNNMGVYGDLRPIGVNPSNAPKEPVWYRTKLLTDLLYNSVYDVAKTTSLNINKDTTEVRGAAFKNTNGTYTYVLWARTRTTSRVGHPEDANEIANANFTFPANFVGTRREQDFVISGTVTNVNSTTVALTGYPSFFTENPPEVRYTLGITATNGSVSKSPNTADYAFNASVNLVAIPTAGYSFAGWTGDIVSATSSITISMNGNKNIVANFIPIVATKYTLETVAMPITGGSIIKSNNTSSYPSGTSVQLTAIAKTGYIFAAWSGSASGTNNPLTVIMDANKKITATFTKTGTILQTILFYSDGMYVIS